MINNLLSFAAVPFNSPIYERMVMGRQELREEVVMELGRQLQDRDSQVSRLLLDTGHGGHQEDQGQYQTRKEQEPSHVFRQNQDSALTCLVIPAAGVTEDETVVTDNNDNPGKEEDNSCQPSSREESASVRESATSVTVAASLFCLLLLFSLAKR